MGADTTLERETKPSAGRVALRAYKLGERPDLAGIGAVVHCAFAHVPGRYRGGEGDDPEGFRRANLDGSLALIRAAAPLTDRMRGLVRMGERRWDVVLDRGQRIMLPETGAVRALERALAMDAAVDMLGREIAAVDLRLPRRPTLRLAGEAVEQYWRIKALETGEQQQ